LHHEVKYRPSGNPSPGLDLPKGYVGLSLGPQSPREPPANCGTHRAGYFKQGPRSPLWPQSGSL